MESAGKDNFGLRPVAVTSDAAKQKPAEAGFVSVLAERAGFEPAVGY